MTLLPPQIADALNLHEGYSAAKEVAKIQKEVFPSFKEQGFISKGRCFNKANPDGTVRVVHFLTMPATSSTYGHFNVAVGVFIPEVWDFKYGSYGAQRPKTFSISDCEIRQDIAPPNAGTRQDQQWEALAHSEMIANLIDKIDAAAATFFTRFADRASIMAELARPGASVPWVHGQAPIILAIIEVEQGDRQSALKRLQFYLDGLDKSTKPGLGHANHIQEIMARLSSWRMRLS